MKTEWVIQNPQATMPLRISLAVDCNMPEETILANVLHNARHIDKWIKTIPEHDGVAVIAGGGPSLADTFDEMMAIGGIMFALNGAAGYLNGRGVVPDYQVIMDAKPEAADLIAAARDYLFASQVNPECFRRKPHATLWHASFGNVLVDEQDGFPVHHDEYAVIGSSVSVGNTALVLLYAMGFRTIHVFGMDSSHRENMAHAYRQPMDDGAVPCTIVECNGKRFISAISMSLQATHFMQRARQLNDAGVTIEVHGDGLLPEMWKSNKAAVEAA